MRPTTWTCQSPQGLPFTPRLCVLVLTLCFLTSRHEDHRNYTAEQLRTLFGVGLLHRCRASLLMRQDSDKEPDPVFKLKALARKGIHPSDVLIAFDDRPSIVAAYREAGIVAYQTAEGW